MNLAAVGRRYVGSESLEKSSRKNILISKMPADKALLSFSQAWGNSLHKNESDSIWWKLHIGRQVPFLREALCTDAQLNPWTVACQAPLSMEFPRKEYWSGLPFPAPGDLLDPGMEPTSPALQVDSLPLSHLESLEMLWGGCKYYHWKITLGVQGFSFN